MRKLNQNNNQKNIKKFKLRNLILIGIVGVLAISSVFMTIETTTSSLEISKLEKTEISLSNQKRDLEETLVKTLSVNDLQQKSSSMGFTQPGNIVYVSSVEPVAKLP